MKRGGESLRLSLFLQKMGYKILLGVKLGVKRHFEHAKTPEISMIPGVFAWRRVRDLNCKIGVLPRVEMCRKVIEINGFQVLPF